MSLTSLTIERAENGYVIKGFARQQVYHTFEEACQYMLGHFEGRFKGLGGKAYGEVHVVYAREE